MLPLKERYNIGNYPITKIANYPITNYPIATITQKPGTNHPETPKLFSFERKHKNKYAKFSKSSVFSVKIVNVFHSFLMTQTHTFTGW